MFLVPPNPPKTKLLPWRNKGDRSGVSKAIHSDPDDGELVSVVKEALANLDHALLERVFLGWIFLPRLMVGKKVMVLRMDTSLTVEHSGTICSKIEPDRLVDG